MAGIVGSAGEEVVMFLVGADGEVAAADIPELEGLVVAGHEVALLVGVVVHSQDAVAPTARINHELLTKFFQGYLLERLSQTWMVLPSVT